MERRAPLPHGVFRTISSLFTMFKRIRYSVDNEDGTNTDSQFATKADVAALLACIKALEEQVAAQSESPFQGINRVGEDKRMLTDGCTAEDHWIQISCSNNVYFAMVRKLENFEMPLERKLLR
jgi:hypothetical protein